MEYIISIITFFAGFVISELIRRMNRAESFNAQIFNKRLEVYCGLYALWNKTYSNMVDFTQAICDDELEQGDKLDVHLKLLTPLLNYLDTNSLFLSEELVVQCGSAYLGFDDFSKEEAPKYLLTIQEQNKVVIAMIKSESGLDMLNKNIKSILHYRHKSPVISYYHKVRKEQGKGVQK